MKEHGIDEFEIRTILEDKLSSDIDFNSGRILSFMSSRPLDLASRIFSENIERNLGRPDAFKGSWELEQELVIEIGEFLHGHNPGGIMTTGGTESNILGLELIRNMTGKKEVIIPRTAHVSMLKACSLLGLKPKIIDVDDNFRADPYKINKAITEDTAGIVATAGTTYLGIIDPIEDIAIVAKNHNLPFHVDAAFGGFVIPFLKELGYNVPDFDFMIDEVTSITIDPHKMALVPIPAGMFLTRNKELMEHIAFKVPYIQGNGSVQYGITGTRSAAPVIATWATINFLGREGFRDIIKDSMSKTKYLVDKIHEVEELGLIMEPIMNIIAIKTQNVDKTAQKLREKGWVIAVSPFPKSLRIIIMPHLSYEDLDDFVKALIECETT